MSYNTVRKTKGALYYFTGTQSSKERGNKLYWSLFRHIKERAAYKLTLWVEFYFPAMMLAK